MSEDERDIKNKKTTILSISLAVVIIFAGILGGSLMFAVNNYNDLSGGYDDLYIDYLELLNDFNQLDEQYFILTGEHVELENDYNDLLSDYNTLQDSYDALEIQYNALQIAYDYITDTIKQSILPVQYSIFAEAVRRYYKDIYVGGLSGKLYWKAFAKFCRDIVLHDSRQYNAFSEVSNAFSNALRFENNTMSLADNIMGSTFYPWLPSWGWIFVPELSGIDIIVDWCIDEIDYEYDSDITGGQEYFNWDYIKFPVETAFRTMGDCEDQAILTATYLESGGQFETAIVIFHDPDHPMFDNGFYHGVLKVCIEDRNAFWDLYPTTSLWSSDGGTTVWCYIDSTWDVPFGSEPSWLQYYIDIGSISWDIHSTAFCDIDGNIQENIGLTCVMPT